jgi:UDP-glucose 4-epimerase
MTVIITGGTGYIGSHMLLELVDAGERALVLDNLSTGYDWAVAPGVPLVVSESGDQDLVARIIRQYGVDASFISPPRLSSPIQCATRSAITATTPSIRARPSSVR